MVKVVNTILAYVSEHFKTKKKSIKEFIFEIEKKITFLVWRSLTRKEPFSVAEYDKFTAFLRNFCKKNKQFQMRD